MLEVLMVLTVVNTALAAAALTMGVMGGRRDRRAGDAPPDREDDEAEEKRPFKLSDAKLQEGINNLMGYEVGGKRGEEE
ncbi:exported hypothetical protein [uncultured Eubacteriales bacterium]|uniref:Uncharacterized protein n=1 Tax=uncultured Eubacteriales bacterium TaxID=172733 RepID=A0A212JSB8_9FIRM|nr:exported hypothetical protein [uncultured Eubacteriales bacterium]